MRQTDNQQATPDFALGWIAAILEGEGTIGCYPSTDKRTQSKYYKPLIRIFNTDEKVIESTHKYLEILDIPHHIGKSKVTFKGKPCKPCYAVRIEGVKRCYTTLPKLIPALYAKKRQAELLLKICKIRLSKPMTRRNQSRKWIGKELGLIDKIRLENQGSPQRL
jgi:hypothetical protein